MLAQRTAQQSLRRFVGQQHTALRLAAPAAIATGNVVRVQRRLAAAQVLSAQDAQNSILASQRLHRPVAPHLGIYKAQVTWYLSGLNRITGCALSGGFYIFGMLYLVAPYVGLHMETAVMAAAVAKWPAVLKVGTKALLALPFTFHCLNGIRHLIWDTASMINNQQVKWTGWTVVALSSLSALALAFV